MNDKLAEILRAGMTLKSVSNKLGIQYNRLRNYRSGGLKRFEAEEWERLNQLHDKLSNAGLI